MALDLQYPCRSIPGLPAARLLQEVTVPAQPTPGKPQGLFSSRRRLLATLAGWPMLAGAQAAPPRLQRLGEHSWWLAAATGDPTPANGGATVQLLVVREGERIWLVGSGPTRAFGTALARAVHEAAGAPVSDIVITRAAPELAMASAAWPGARLWALSDVAAAMRERCGECQQRLKAALGAAGDDLVPQDIRVPDHTVGAPGAEAGRLGPFEWRALARGGGERALVLRQRDDAVVLAQGFVWAGDLPDLRGTRQPAFADSLRQLREWAAGQRLLGEQGGLCDSSQIERHLAYLQALHAALAPRIARGEAWPGSDAGLPAAGALAGDAARHALNVQHLWLELEDGSLR